MARGKPKYGLPDLDKEFTFDFKDTQRQKLEELGWSEPAIEKLAMAGRIYRQDAYLIEDAPKTSDHIATLEAGLRSCRQLLKLLTDANISTISLVGLRFVQEQFENAGPKNGGTDDLVQGLEALEKTLIDLVERPATLRYDPVFIRRKLVFAISVHLTSAEKDVSKIGKKSKIYQTVSTIYAALKIPIRDPGSDIKYVLSNDI